MAALEMIRWIVKKKFVFTNSLQFTQLYSVRNCYAQHTLRVMKEIKNKRQEALLGGGQKRIDDQHRKVMNNN